MSNRQQERFDLHDIVVKVITLSAVMIELDGDEYWIPKSQIHGDIRKTDTSISMTPWIAKQKGLY